eukprot:9010514-Pyramimonas_sp.AAC.1
MGCHRNLGGLWGDLWEYLGEGLWREPLGQPQGAFCLGPFVRSCAVPAPPSPLPPWPPVADQR